MACAISALFEGIVLVLELGFWGLVWWVVLDSFLYFSLTLASLFKWGDIKIGFGSLTCLYKP